jgi:hypothetical protein
MKAAVFLTMILALTAPVASAGVVGIWIADSVSGYSRYTLQVWSDFGTMSGFDMAVYDPGGHMHQDGGVFSTAVDADTHFLFQESHVVPNPNPPPPPVWTIADLAVAPGTAAEDTTFLQAAFAATAGGVYDGGFTNPVNVCQIVTSQPINPYLDLAVYATDWTSAPQARIGVGSGAYLVPFWEPEPSTVVLLVGLGLAGLIAWRRR